MSVAVCAFIKLCLSVLALPLTTQELSLPNFIIIIIIYFTQQYKTAVTNINS